MRNRFFSYIGLLGAVGLTLACTAPQQQAEARPATPQPYKMTPAAVYRQETVVIELTPTPTPVPTPTPIPTPTPTPVPTPTPTPTPVPTPTPTPEPLGILDWHYADRFSESVIDTKEEYRDATRSFTITRVADKERTGLSLVYFVADIWVQDVSSLRRAQANEKFRLGATASAKKLSKTYDSLLAISGDYCSTKYPSYVVINGEVAYDSKKYKRDLCVLYKDGTMETYGPKEIDPAAIQAKDPWITWNFGPSLLDENGEPKKKFNLPDTIAPRNPRSAIGYFEPGHYCFVLVDGRQKGYSYGLSIEELAALMHELGCVAAYNLDGGISAQMTRDDELVNSPGSIRSIRDIVYIPREVFPNEYVQPGTELDPLPEDESVEQVEASNPSDDEAPSNTPEPNDEPGAAPSEDADSGFTPEANETELDLP